MRYPFLPAFLFLVFGSHPGFAQDLHANGTKGVFVPPPMMNSNQSNQRLEPPARSTTPYGQSSTMYQVSSYLFTNWTLGVLRPYTGPVRREWLKYNALNHQLIYRTYVKETEVPKQVKLNTLREFTVGDSALGLRVTYRRYLDAQIAKPALRTAFFEVHYDTGRTALLCRRTHTPAVPLLGPSGFTGSRDVLKYYLKTSSNLITAIDLGPGDLIQALETAHREALTAYTKQEQLDLRLERDVVRLLVYNDALPR